MKTLISKSEEEFWLQSLLEILSMDTKGKDIADTGLAFSKRSNSQYFSLDFKEQ